MAEYSESSNDVVEGVALGQVVSSESATAGRQSGTTSQHDSTIADGDEIQPEHGEVHENPDNGRLLLQLKSSKVLKKRQFTSARRSLLVELQRGSSLHAIRPLFELLEEMEQGVYDVLGVPSSLLEMIGLTIISSNDDSTPFSRAACTSYPATRIEHHGQAEKTDGAQVCMHAGI